MNRQWILKKNEDAFASTQDITHDARSVISKKILIGKKEKSVSVKSDMPFPKRIKPMLATLVNEAFSDKEWIYEIKWDGYRAIGAVHKGAVDLYSRNFTSFNENYPSIVAALQKIKEDVVLDGEIVAYDQKGAVSFQTLQNMGRKGTKADFIIFDILYKDGEDLTKLPLIKRKGVLKDFLKVYPHLSESEYIEEDGDAFFKLAVKKNLEGIMAKKKDSPYVGNKRTEFWLKIKHHHTTEAVIAGFTKPRGSRSHFGALVLGVYDKDALIFVGHTGTGFSDKKLEELYGRMKPLIQRTPTIPGKIPLNAPVTWVKPKLVAELKFAEWTKGGNMRQPVFLGLRTDKPAKSVIQEKEEATEKVLKEVKQETTFTNTEKIYFPELKITKGDVLSYYDRMAPFILPYLKDRPESLNRHPNGIHKPNFFQKNITNALPPYVETIKIFSESNNADINYLMCQNKETLLYLANLGCIELNPWNSRKHKLDFPDYMIIDLDPGNNTWAQMVTVAKEVKKVLDGSCEKSYLKTSGKTGLHICVPLGAKYHFDDVRTFAELIAHVVYKRLPKITSIERSPAKRKNKIYLDYLQNRTGQTIAAPYALRPTKEATVSTPLLWSELSSKITPAKFTIFTIEKRLKKVGDLWKNILKESVDLKKSISCLEEVLAKE
jgi:bifunctional non-homologous end joining protein LigD